MSARQALDVARPVFARMDASRGADSTRADLIEAWTAVEKGLQTLVGNTSAGGQSLIRDARARQLLTFDQANSLVTFLSIREKLDSGGYQPTDADVNAARGAFLKLDAGLSENGTSAPSVASPGFAPGAAAPAPPSVPQPASIATAPATGPGVRVERRIRKLNPVWVVLILVTLAGGFAAAAFFFWPARGGGDALAQAIQAYGSGQRETAAIGFQRAARANPGDALPHVYLARMAREVGNTTVANEELQTALKVQPGSLDGRREYGSFFLAQGNYDQARVWYTHALEIDPSDVSSQGWLGCALIKLNRVDEGMRWLTRAGTGQWSACRPGAQQAPPPIRP